MQVIINHLTRMTNPTICIAGIDDGTKTHIRPQLFQGKLNTSMLANKGGNISLGALLELGNVTPIPSPPENEDHKFDGNNLKLLKQFKSDEFWDLLKTISKKDLLSIFGSDLLTQNKSAKVGEGKGTCSLGCLLLSHQPRIMMNNDKLRLLFTNGNFNLDLSITDLRFYNHDFSQINQDVINQANTYIEQGDQIILSVGLTRVFRPSDGTPPYFHWLQVNNIHFESNPLW